MNFIKKLLLITVLLSGIFLISGNIQVNAVDSYAPNIIIDNPDTGTNRNADLDDFGNSEDEFFTLGTYKGEQGIFYLLVEIAQSLKNLFFWIATIFYIVISIKLLVAENTEEEVGKFKKGIIWITIGLMIMQIAYAFTLTLYAQNVGEALAFDLIDNIINPFIGLLEVLASIFFMAIAIFSFFRMVTANGKEEEITRSKMAIVYAIMGFILIKVAKIIVEGVYGKLDCSTSSIAGFDFGVTSCIGEAQLETLSGTFMQIINWANGFIGIITLLLIIYAGFNVLFSAGNEEKIKKAKNTILYIAIGLFLLVVNYLLLTFFIIPESVI